MKWYLIVSLIGASPTRRGVEHLSMCLFGVSVSSFEKELFKSFSHF